MENSKTRREAALLVLVVFLLGVLLGGLGNHLWGERVWGRQNPLGSPTRDQLVNDLTHELQLTATQEQQLRQSDCGRHASENSHRLCAGGCAARGTAAAGACTHSRDSRTPEQLPKFEAFMQRLDEQRKKDEAAKPKALIRGSVPRFVSTCVTYLEWDIFVGDFRAVA